MHSQPRRSRKKDGGAPRRLLQLCDKVEYHDQLLRDASWINNAFLTFAERADVPDVKLFARCLQDDEPLPTIEEGIAAAERIGARGTPAVLANGVLLGEVPMKYDQFVELLNAARQEVREPR